MSYQAIILCSVQSLEPETALDLQEYVKNGGKLIIVDGTPHRSLSMHNATANDAIVQKSFLEMLQNYPDRIFKLDSPASEAELLSWTTDLLGQISIKTDVTIENPDKNVFQIRQTLGDKDIYFFTNSNSEKKVTLKALFPTGLKTPWVWKPENGTRKVFPFDKYKNDLTIELEPLHSILLVFDPYRKGEPDEIREDGHDGQVITLKGPWKADFQHVDGSNFERTFDELVDIGSSNDSLLNTFAGTITYTTTFKMDGKGRWLELDQVNKGITEVSLNGKSIGINWYGKPRFSIDGLQLKEENVLQIKYTSVLNNYVRSLKNNLMAERWTSGSTNIPIGLEGNVKIIFNPSY